MKARNIYIIGVVVFLLGFVLLTLKMPRQFVWKDTFKHNDTQPYGCYAFDSLMSQTMPQGYSVSEKRLNTLVKEKLAPRNYLITMDDIDFDTSDYKALRSLATAGSRVIVAGNRSYTDEMDSLIFKDYGVRFSHDGYQWRKAVRSGVLFEPVYWNEDDRYGFSSYDIPEVIRAGFLTTDTISTLKTLAFAENSIEMAERTSPVAVSVQVGKGAIIFVCEPLLFTNYGILMKSTRGYTMRLMSQLQNAPVERLTWYCPVADNEIFMDESKSPTDFFLDHKPLRVALWLTVLLIVLLMIFKARRRQRAIPIYHEPKNRTLEFAKLIGTLYYQRRDNLDLVKKKYRIFAELLRRRLAIDVMTVRDEQSDVDVLAQRTGLDTSYLTSVLHDLRNAYFGNVEITDLHMKMLIEQMNDITERL